MFDGDSFGVGILLGVILGFGITLVFDTIKRGREVNKEIQESRLKREMRIEFNEQLTRLINDLRREFKR